MSQKVRLGDFLGNELEEDFANFDLTEIQEVLNELSNTEAIDLPHAEILQIKALRGADIVSGYLAKIVKTIGYLETKVNSTKNKISLEYQAPEGQRTTLDMKRWAADVSPEVDAVQIKLATAKGSKNLLDKKYDILIKSHHNFKEIAAGMRKSILGYTLVATDKVPEGYE